MDKLQIVVGGLYGSEGKGAIAAHLTHPDRFHDGLAIRVGGSQAGHTVYDRDGRKWPLRHIPVAAVVNPDCRLAIAAGSEIDLHVLQDEIDRLESTGHKIRNRLTIDPAATVITEQHKLTEQAGRLTDRLGSTAKGVGAARADRIMRHATTIAGLWAPPHGVHIADTAAQANRHGGQVLIEGTQGYGLGLHTSFYPYTTSGDCRNIDFLAQAGITNPDWLCQTTTWVVLRPYPIRVAGNSGTLHGETTWEALGLPPEQTTVTQKTRRVGTWDWALALAAVLANGGPHPTVRLALTMADQLSPTIAQATHAEELDDTIRQFVHRVESDTQSPGQLQLIGTSPTTVVDLRDGR